MVYLCHHATPSDNIRIASCSGSLLQINDGLEKTVEVIVSSVIELLKGVEAL